LAYSASIDDGHEELIHGARFTSLEPQATLKDILCTGNDTNPHLILGADGAHSDLIAPSILLKDINLEKIDRPPDKLRILDNPVFTP
jgi:hypothetical protein